MPRALRALAMTHYKMRYKPGGRTGFAMAGSFTWGAVGRATARVAPMRDKKCRRRRGHPYEGHEKRTDRVVRPNGVLRILDRK